MEEKKYTLREVKAYGESRYAKGLGLGLIVLGCGSIAVDSIDAIESGFRCGGGGIGIGILGIIMGTAYILGWNKVYQEVSDKIKYEELSDKLKNERP